MSETLSSIVRRDDRVAPSASLHVEVIADLVCPFCFIGKREFDKALKAVKGPSDVSWYPYQLNPEIPAEGQPFDVYLKAALAARPMPIPFLRNCRQEARRQASSFDSTNCATFRIPCRSIR